MKLISVNSIFVFLCCCVLLSCNVKSKDGIEIAAKGTSNYEIVFNGNETGASYKSALILADYLFKISGAKIPLVGKSSQGAEKSKIYVGTLGGGVLGENELNLRTEDNNIYISGGSDSATKNAVYEFLEKQLGCRWYAPEAEEIPKKDVLIVEPVDYSFTPEIITRTVHSRLFYDNHDFADKQRVTYEGFPNYVPSAGVHTFHKFLPEEKFYKSNPEYFALRGNKRLPTQLCLTNTKVLEIVKDSVSALFKRYPASNVISVSQDDNQQYCQCENCSKIDKEEGSPSGTMVRFVNQVASEFPDKTISTLAYQYTRKPSTTKPADNVLITLCSIECDRSDSIEKNCSDFAEDLKGWSAITDNIRIWDYTTQFTNFLSPFPNLYTLQPNLKLFRDNNAKWVFEQHSRHPSELFELRSYVTAKLLWNPDLNFDNLLTEFTNGYYKEAGVYVKKYVDLIHKKIAEDDDFFLFLYGDPSEAFSSYLNMDLLKEYSALFDEAEKAVAIQSNVLERVRTARLGIDYAVLEASKKNMSKDYSLVLIAENDVVIVNPLVLRKLENFKTVCIQNNITLMNEMGFKVEEYYFNYKKALEVAQKPNKALGKKVVSLTKPKKYANENPMVLTDGALGGSSFYANWLGYEGNDMEVVIDLGEPQEISSISMAFLQVTNHIVFFPDNVSCYGSNDTAEFIKLAALKNEKALNKKSKVNDIQYFDFSFKPKRYRYLKIMAKNVETPYWHHAAGLPSWVFADEVIVD